WYEMLGPYPRANKQNQKKKRKVDPPTQQEPGPAKVTVTSTSIPAVEKIPDPKSSLWQEELKHKAQRSRSPSEGSAHDGTVPSLPHATEEPLGSTASTVNKGEVRNSERTYHSYRRVEKNLFSHRHEPPVRSDVGPQLRERRRDGPVASRSGTMEEDLPERMELDYDHEQERGAERQGRSEKRAYALREPDLLNFKKGWMVKLDDDCQWKKHWFVLTDHGLRYYKDSIAEEASDLDGEIDLSTCYGVTEVQAQRNYGFQIQTKEGSFTLSAMTTGIRRNWIQAIMKNVRPSTAPDVTSLPDTVPKLDTRGTDASLLAPDSAYSGADGEQQQQQRSSRKSRARDRRRTTNICCLEWPHFFPSSHNSSTHCVVLMSLIQHPPLPTAPPPKYIQSILRSRDTLHPRVPQINSLLGVGSDIAGRSPLTADDALLTTCDPFFVFLLPTRWQQVEQTPLRESKQVPIHSHLTPTAQRPPTDGLVELLEKELLRSRNSQRSGPDLRLNYNRVIRDWGGVISFEGLHGNVQSQNKRYLVSGALAGAGSGVRQQLRRLNKELRAELERQRERLELVTLQSRTLRQSYTASRELIQRQEAELASLHKCVEVLSAERAALEQSLGEALLGREEERADGPVEGAAAASAAGASEVAARLGESEAKLEAARSLLLEKTQALGELERQVEMQGNQQEVVQRLRERLEEATERLRASERELAKNREDFEARRRALLETQEAKTQGIRRRLQELEDALKEREERVEKLETCVDRLENEKVAAVLENRKLEQKMRDDEVSLESLQRSKETVEEDNQQLYQRQKELGESYSELSQDMEALKVDLEQQCTEKNEIKDFYESLSQEMERVRAIL
uniref:PH domain-containing protein n=1 Tax=Petromyzon marinus TaxID=7757 RepID=S4RUW7_PETMA